MDHVISAQWRMLSQPTALKPPPQGLDRLWLRAKGYVGRASRDASHYLKMVDRIIQLEKHYSALSDHALAEEAKTLQHAFRRNRDTAAERDRAFALVRQVALRTVGLHPYKEQIAGALALNDGCIAEMATGEGKTLVATMPAVVAGWRGRGCHVITANDYLAERDAKLMAPIYRFCGLTVACIKPDMAPDARRQAYNAHVTYCTNKEVAADFLRDRLAGAGVHGLPEMLLSKLAGRHHDRMGRLVQRGLEYAIVDEADAIFIDEASTPLLISGDGPNHEQIEAYAQAARLAAQLESEKHYRVADDRSTVKLTSAGKTQIEALAEPLGGLWRGRRRREELVLLALIADAVYIRNKHYIVDDDAIVIVDQFTGRLMPDRTWRNGLHQAIEAKEGLEINLPKETFARISFQRFYRLYRKLSGMSGTVAEARDELWATYQVPVVEIPTHRPCLRKTAADRVFSSDAAKWQAIVEEVDRVHQTGRPILVGTGSIGESERLSALLTENGLAHCLLNAMRHEKEAEIIAQAGEMGRITVSTNMAGRGTDIKLGSGVARLGGLHVIATERFPARRIDRQLSGRSARHGDPGSNQVFASLEDTLTQKDTRFAFTLLRRLAPAKDRELRSAFWRSMIGAAQKRAERLTYRMRRDVMAADSWLDEQMGFTATE